MVALLAIGAAFFWGTSYVVTRVGLRYANPLSGVLITTAASLFVSLSVFLFALPIDQFANRAVVYFVAAGVTGPFMGRFFFYVGIDRVGTSIATPLAETKTLFSAIAAVLILSEKLTSFIALATLLMIIGAGTISSEQSGGQIEKEWSKRDLIFPFLTAAAWGLTHVFRKMGLNFTPEPTLAVAIQNTTALALFPLLAMAQRNQQRMVLNDRRAWFVFSLSGFLNFAAQLSMTCALNLGQVVIVSPLSALSPFFVLLFVGVFLRKLERVTWKIVIGSVCIVAGTVVLTVISQG